MSSLVPMLYSDWWEDLDRPHSLHDQYFGLPVDPEEMLHRGEQEMLHRARINRHAENLGYPFFRRMRRRHHPYHHALAQRHDNNKGYLSLCNTDRDKFLVNLDVKQFSPDEITVKTIDKYAVVVEAKHEEKEDEHGLISRQFTRKYSVPSNYDIEQMETMLSSDGILTITAPKKKSIGDASEKILKIHYTGEPAILDQQPSKTVEGHGEELRGDHSQQQQQQQQQLRAGQTSQQRGKKITVKGV